MMATPVLLLDRDGTRRAELAEALGRQGDLDVIPTSTRGEALEVFAQRRLALMLLDLSVAHGGGLDVLRAVRRTSPLPVILLTGLGHEAERVAGLELGADDYVLTPCGPHEVDARIRTTLRRARSVSDERPLCFEGLTIDPACCEVRRGDRLVELTARELALLVHLASQPRRVFTRDELLRAVWASEPGWQGTGTVTEHIHRLRRKLEEDRTRPRWLQTVRGIGYRFAP